MDETWIHHFPQKSNRQSGERTAAGENRPKRPKKQNFSFVLWDVQDIFFIDYLEKRRTINSEYYIVLLVNLKEEIAKKKQPQMKKKNMHFQQENAPCHKSIAVMAELQELNFQLLPHSIFYPDLAPSDYWLIPDFKRMLQGKRFGSSKEVKSETGAYFEARDKSFSKKASNC